MDREQGGRFFRQAWIDGVNKYYPGTPKPSYIAPWENMPDWEKDVVTALYEQAHTFVKAGIQDRQAPCLNREQGGRFIRIGWIGQVYKHVPDPKPAYVCKWEDMSSWEQEVDIDIFQAIQNEVYQEAVQHS